MKLQCMRCLLFFPLFPGNQPNRNGKCTRNWPKWSSNVETDDVGAALWIKNIEKLGFVDWPLEGGSRERLVRSSVHLACCTTPFFMNGGRTEWLAHGDWGHSFYLILSNKNLFPFKFVYFFAPPLNDQFDNWLTEIYYCKEFLNWCMTL